MEKNWKEEAWENFLKIKWDNRPQGLELVKYTKEELEKFLSKYPKSGQGEIRIFHYEHEKIKAVKIRNVMKVPISRTVWALVRRPPKVIFSEPKETKNIDGNKLTDGMKQAIWACLGKKNNPGETTLLAVAKHVGIISDFYNLTSEGVMFTGGRQNAVGCHIVIDNKELDLSKAQIEIDGAYEWSKEVVIVEMKSSFEQNEFDLNQVLLPLLKWKDLLKNKMIYSMVILAETKDLQLIYYAYDLTQSTKISPFGMEINKTLKYVVNIPKG